MFEKKYRGVGKGDSEGYKWVIWEGRTPTQFWRDEDSSMTEVKLNQKDLQGVKKGYWARQILCWFLEFWFGWLDGGFLTESFSYWREDEGSREGWNLEAFRE